MSKNRKNESSTLIGQAKSLTDLADYQEGLVVSRTLVDKKAGTITLFAFDIDQGLSEHTAPYDALLYVFDGEAEVTVSGKPLPLKAGMVTLLPAGKPHSLKAVSRLKIMLVMIKA